MARRADPGRSSDRGNEVPAGDRAAGCRRHGNTDHEAVQEDHRAGRAAACLRRRVQRADHRYGRGPGERYPAVAPARARPGHSGRGHLRGSATVAGRTLGAAAEWHLSETQGVGEHAGADERRHVHPREDESPHRAGDASAGRGAVEGAVMKTHRIVITLAVVTVVMTVARIGVVIAGAPTVPASASSGRLVVHEWGTFLAMNGSDGATLDGMYHEEHALPGFVHARSRNELSLRTSNLKG